MDWDIWLGQLIFDLNAIIETPRLSIVLLNDMNGDLPSTLHLSCALF
jgi:hypothetical protein